MTKIEIDKFICEASKKEIRCSFFNPNEQHWRFLSGHPAWTSKDYHIYLNEHMWGQFPENTKKYLLLHELGHIHDSTPYDSSSVERELFAQMWGVRKAKSLGLRLLAKQMKNLLGTWEYVYDWNSNHRKYILASKLAKKRGLI